MPAETDSWIVQGVAEAHKPRRLTFYEPARKLFATLVVTGKEKEPVVVRLQPGAAVRGRVVDRDGTPQSGVNVNLTYHDGDFWGMHAFIHGARPVATDRGGGFVIDEVIPGIEFQLWRRLPKRDGYGQLLIDRVQVKPGRTKDLKDLRLPPAR